MKHSSLLIFPLLTATSLFAQSVAVNTDGTTAHASSILDVKSTTKGMLMPRMTSAQRSAIASPVTGLLVFDTDTKTIWAFNGTIWTNLSTAGAGFTLPYENTVALAGSAFKITNSGIAIEGATSGAAASGIKGTATQNGSNGVHGVSSAASGVGVRGESNTGTGMLAYSTSGTGLSASSISGTGIYANSLSGLALHVSGNLRIAGGNTNPSNGAVLTSDASGNAVWKANRVGFHASGINPSYDDLNSGTWYRLIYMNELYDFTNSHATYTGNAQPAPSTAGYFTVPVDGVYHFESYFSLWVDDVTAAGVSATVRLSVNRNGNIFHIEQAPPIEKTYSSWLEGTSCLFKISGDYFLVAGDRVYAEVYHSNSDNKHAQILDSYNHRFSGRLVIPF